jgi:hypothetical protein
MTQIAQIQAALRATSAPPIVGAEGIMADPDLEKRVQELEAELAALRQAQPRGIRKRASWDILGLPAYDIALGPDPSAGEMRGHARGFLAVGDMATGVLAVGGFSRGVVAVGGAAIGGLTFGGFSLGLIFALGGCAIGNLAVGGGAIGRIAIGGGAVGVYALGGGAAGLHVVSATRQDPEAVAFFDRFGLRPPRRR